MLNCKIIADSSADLLTVQGVPFASVPLKIVTDEKEYIDNDALNVDEMIDDLLRLSGPSGSSCPNAAEWKQAFEDYDCVFCVTITSNLSGSFNAAKIALDEYLYEHPERKGFVIDTLSAGPEVALVVEKLVELVQKETAFDTVVKKITAYQEQTHLLFALESLRNLANNGRVNGAVAKFAGLLGIRVIGKASEEGTLSVSGKAKGSKKTIFALWQLMEKTGYAGGRVRIHHCHNIEAAEQLSALVLKKYPRASVLVQRTRGLCSFYAEKGGLLIGFEA